MSSSIAILSVSALAGAAALSAEFAGSAEGRDRRGSRGRVKYVDGMSMDLPNEFDKRKKLVVELLRKGRAEEARDVDGNGGTFVLPGANLEGFNLEGLSAANGNFAGAKLAGAKLRSAVLRYVDFTGADLSSAILQNASMHHAKLVGANLSDANLIGTRLIGADLTGARFAGANLHLANLSRTNLADADLTGASLDEAILPEGFLAPNTRRDAVKWTGTPKGWRLVASPRGLRYMLAESDIGPG